MTTSSMTEMCAHNCRTADQRLQEARQQLRDLDEPGPAQNDARLLVRRYLAEREHWREYQRHYQRLSERPASERSVRLVKTPEPDRRLPREREEDERDDLPF